MDKCQNSKCQNAGGKPSIDNIFEPCYDYNSKGAKGFSIFFVIEDFKYNLHFLTML